MRLGQKGEELGIGRCCQSKCTEVILAADILAFRDAFSKNLPQSAKGLIKATDLTASL
jgi:hypothetical protein